MFVEGLLRVLAAAMQQPFGTAPIVIARAAWAARPRARLPDDIVTRSGAAVVIDSARDYDWHALTLRSPLVPPPMRFLARLNLGDAYAIHAVHVERHTKQIERVIATIR